MAPTVSDVREWLSHHSLAFTHITECRWSDSQLCALQSDYSRARHPRRTSMA